MKTAATVCTDFAARLYGELAKTPASKNLFLSPFSIQVALAMCAAGARGETRTALVNLLGAPGSVDEQNRQYSDWIKAVNGSGDRSFQLSTANALWGQQGHRFNPDYKKLVADFYSGAFNELDFHKSPAKAVQEVNAWVEAKTGGKIKDLLSRDLIDADMRLILTNAIYFKGAWETEFDRHATLDEDWYSPGGVFQVPMMQQRKSFPYWESADLQAVDLPYKGGLLAMLVVLPRTKDGLAALEKNWTRTDVYRQVTDSLRPEGTVIVSLPRFKMEAEFRLKSVLCEMGAGQAFGDQADFTGIDTDPLKLSEVVHKAFIEVNEEGTEAAAATGVVMKLAAGPGELKLFQADHPFLFLIRDRKTNAVLFCGRVLDPR